MKQSRVEEIMDIARVHEYLDGECKVAVPHAVFFEMIEGIQEEFKNDRTMDEMIEWVASHEE